MNKSINTITVTVTYYSRHGASLVGEAALI